jgi:site-specific recombinase XerD
MNAITPTPANQIIQSQPLDQNPAAVYLASLTSERSRATMIQALNEIAHALGTETVTVPDTTSPRRKERDMTFLACPWTELRYQHTAALRSQLAAKHAPATANKMLAALRGVLKQAYKLGQMDADDYNRAIELKAVKGDTLPAGRDLAQGEIMALVMACRQDTSAAGARDAAIIGTLYTSGLRRAEMVGLDRTDLADDGKLTIRSGKGRKDRIVYITNGALTALAAWLAVRGESSGPLFVPVNKGGKVTSGQRMTTQAIYNILMKRAAEAGVKDFSPHDFRRTFASELLDLGADIVTVSKLMGHADVKTTARYDRRPETAKRKAAGLLHFPYSAEPVPAAPQQLELPPARRQVGRTKSQATPDVPGEPTPPPPAPAKVSRKASAARPAAKHFEPGQKVYLTGEPERIGIVTDARPEHHKVQVQFPQPGRPYKHAVYTHWYDYTSIEHADAQPAPAEGLTDIHYDELIKAALNKRAGWVYLGPVETARRGVKLNTYGRANDLADLEQAGLILLTPSKDGQKATITLTEAGKAAIQAMPDDIGADFYPLPVDIAAAKARVQEPTPVPEAKARRNWTGFEYDLNGQHYRVVAHHKGKNWQADSTSDKNYRAFPHEDELAAIEHDQLGTIPDELTKPITGVKDLQQRLNDLGSLYLRRWGHNWALYGAKARRDGKDYFADTADGQPVFLGGKSQAAGELLTWFNTGKDNAAARRQR